MGYPKNIIGVKDSSYNLFENLKIDNFSVLPGSESKLFKGLQLGCSGIITATCNATSSLARKVYDDFNNGNDQTVNQNLCEVRAEFEKYNLISGLHTYFSKKEIYYKNLLPPLSILNAKDELDLINNLKSYIIGNPKSENPIKVNILNKNLHYKLLFHPDLYFGEAYTDGEITIENGTLTDFLDLSLMNFGRGDLN